MKILIKNAKAFIDNEFVKTDILLENNRIIKIEDEISELTEKVIDANENIVLPGLIDLHVHLRDPGQTYKEDIVSGTRAAVKGGFTTICAMPNTDPIVDNLTTVEYIKRKAKDLGFCKVEVIGALTKKSEEKEITEIYGMMQGGIVAVSDDGKCIQNSKLMLNSLKYASKFDMPVIIHAEDYKLSGNGQINSGKMSTKLGLGGIPALSEEIIVSRDIMLAESAKCKIHIAHISTKKAVQMVREAKRKGLPVTAEVTPHHLLLNESYCENFDTNTKMKPPLRTENDRQALIEGVIDGTIDFIATDHAPHADYEKEREFMLAPFGIIGLETAFATLYTNLVLKKIIPFEKLINAFTKNPANFLKKKIGIIKEGYTADLTIINLAEDIHFSQKTIISKSKNTPFLGQTFKGKVITTICEGKIAWEAE